jgi:hypothetical protein
MKLETDDPRLTAYVLGECPPGDEAAIARAIAADPALAIAAREIEAVERLLAATLSDGAEKLSPRQHATILAAARAADAAATDAPPVVFRPRPRFSPWIGPVAAAAAVVLGIVLFLPDDAPTGEGTTANTDDGEKREIPISMLPSPGPVDASAPREGSPAANPSPPMADSHPVLRPRGPVSSAHHPSLDLPIQSGRASYGWVTDAILRKGVLPKPDAVRSEEILNHFRIRPVGATAIHRGLTLTAETLPCPWKPSATLAVVTVRGNREAVREVTATWNADASAVWRYRLLGHAVPIGVAPRPLARTLPAGAEHTLVLEIEPSSATQHGLGEIAWTVDGHAAPSLAIARSPGQSAGSVSADARFAAFVCLFSEWLREPRGETSDPALVAALAREVAADPPASGRADFLALTRKALEIAASPPE